MGADLTSTARTRVRRKPERARHDRALVDVILDEALVCQVAFTDERGPVVVPTIHARIDDVLYLHGASGNRMLRTLAAGADACVTATLVDALVLARSAFHHSLNYRSVMLFGRATAVDDEAEKRRALDAVVEHVLEGRARECRPPSPSELRRTLVLRFPIVEASVKVRDGGPVDEPDDVALPHWAGIVPLQVTAGTPVAYPVGAGASPGVPGSVRRLTAPGG